MILMKRIKCKHCGNDDGFYIKERYSGENEYYYSFTEDKNILDINENIYQGAEHKLKSKFLFCYNCDKKVCKIEDVDLDTFTYKEK